MDIVHMVESEVQYEVFRYLDILFRYLETNTALSMQRR